MRRLLLLAVWTGCHGAAPARAPLVADPACAGETGLVARVRGPIAAVWEGRATRGGDGTLDVRWCGAGTVSIVRVEVGDPARWIHEPDPETYRLVRGSPAALTIHGQPAPGTQPVVVTVVDGAGRELRATTTAESIDDPARVAARAACTACGGRWGAAGMLGYEQCDCPTRDAGKRCTSDRDCESVCIPTDVEEVPAAEAAGVTCGRHERVVRLVGRCHDRTLSFGCRPYLPDTGPRCGPVDGALTLPTLCTD